MSGHRPGRPNAGCRGRRCRSRRLARPRAADPSRGPRPRQAGRPGWQPARRPRRRPLRVPTRPGSRGRPRNGGRHGRRVAAPAAARLQGLDGRARIGDAGTIRRDGAKVVDDRRAGVGRSALIDGRRAVRRRRVQQQRHVLPAVVGARSGRIDPVVGGDEAADRPGRKASTMAGRAASTARQAAGEAIHVVAMAPDHVEIHQVGHRAGPRRIATPPRSPAKQPRRPRAFAPHRGSRRWRPTLSFADDARPTKISLILPSAITGTPASASRSR